MRKLLGLFAALTALAATTALSAGPAFAGSARQPVTGSFTINQTYVDDGASAACGFTITETDMGIGHYEVFFDSTGTPVRAQVEVHYTGVFTANGLTLNVAGDGLSIFDLNGGETQIGVFKFSLTGGGVLTLEVGRLVFDDNGNLVFEAGPHPSLHGETASVLCPALTP